MTTSEVPKSTPKLNLPVDSRFDLNPPDHNSLAAHRRPFARIMTQTNAFPKMDIPIKPPAFMDAGEPSVFLCQEEIETSCQPFSYLLLLIPMVGRALRRPSRLFLLGSNPNLTSLLVYWIPITFSLGSA